MLATRTFHLTWRLALWSSEYHRPHLKVSASEICLTWIASSCYLFLTYRPRPFSPGPPTVPPSASASSSYSLDRASFISLSTCKDRLRPSSSSSSSSRVALFIRTTDLELQQAPDSGVLLSLPPASRRPPRGGDCPRRRHLPRVFHPHRRRPRPQRHPQQQHKHRQQLYLRPPHLNKSQPPSQPPPVPQHPVSLQPPPPPPPYPPPRCTPTTSCKPTTISWPRPPLPTDLKRAASVVF